MSFVYLCQYGVPLKVKKKHFFLLFLCIEIVTDDRFISQFLSVSRVAMVLYWTEIEKGKERNFKIHKGASETYVLWLFDFWLSILFSSSCLRLWCEGSCRQRPPTRTCLLCMQGAFFIFYFPHSK